VTSYSYDALNRRISKTDPDNRTIRYSYDAADRRTGLQNARGGTTTYGYDNAGQLTSITFSDTAMHEIDYGYDAAGRRVSMTDATGQSQYSYDSLGRLTEISTPGPIGRIAPDSGAGALLDGHENVDYSYDLAGRVTQVKYPDSLPNGAAVAVNGQQISNGRPTVTRRYDHAGRLVEVDDFKARRFLFTYDPDGHLTAASYPNATSTANVYDRRGNLTRTTVTNPNGTQLDLPFGYDADNLLTSTTATSALSQLGETYGYDALHQVTSAVVPTGQGTDVIRDNYGYDAGDRITAIQRPTVNLFLSYDNADQLTRASDPLTNTTLATFGYDADGNRTATTDISGTSTAYDYDQRDQLTRYRNQASTTVTTIGAHVSSTLTSSTPADETYHYNGDGLRADFIWDPTTGIPAILEDKTHLFIQGPSGLPLEEVDLAGNALYYHHDQLGSTRLLTNQDGHPVAYSDYDPYGRPIKPVDAALNPLGYAGQYTEAASGLIYLRARWYDPATGTFLTTDPLGVAGGDLNPYGYASRDPINASDPAGLCAIGDFEEAMDAVSEMYAELQSAWAIEETVAAGEAAAEAGSSADLPQAMLQLTAYETEEGFVFTQQIAARKLIATQVSRAEQELNDEIFLEKLGQPATPGGSKAVQILYQLMHLVSQFFPGH
jgi:RHS repeat-associated protein